MKPKTKTTKKPEPKQITEAEHFRRRLPSEKPARLDIDRDGRIIAFDTEGYVQLWDWEANLSKDFLCWLPGHLPSHLIPKPETPEEKMRREFEAWAESRDYDLTLDNSGEYKYVHAHHAWLAWEAAKSTTP